MNWGTQTQNMLMFSLNIHSYERYTFDIIVSKLMETARRPLSKFNLVIKKKHLLHYS